MKFNITHSEYDYLTAIHEAVENQNKTQAEKFLLTWKGKWIEAESNFGLMYGKIEDCEFYYQYDTGELYMNLTLSEYSGKEFVIRNITKFNEMSDKQIDFHKIRSIIYDNICESDYDKIFEIKKLIRNFSLCDIKRDEKSN